MHRRADALVLAALLLVGGLLALAGVSRVRDAADRVACANNLRQLGQAVWNYESSQGRFPQATVPNADLPPERRFSWLVDTYYYVEATFLLPYDLEQPWDAEQNRVVQRPYVSKTGEECIQDLRAIRYLLCPANPSWPEPGSHALTHYVGCAGLGRTAAALRRGDRRAGFFGYERTLRVEDVKDGTSTTLLALETRRDNGPWVAGGYATVRGLELDGPEYIAPAGSFGYHRGGTNALFADGSVRFLKDTMDRGVFEALATVAGHEEAGTVSE